MMVGIVVMDGMDGRDNRYLMLFGTMVIVVLVVW